MSNIKQTYSIPNYIIYLQIITIYIIHDVLTYTSITLLYIILYFVCWYSRIIDANFIFKTFEILLY